MKPILCSLTAFSALACSASVPPLSEVAPQPGEAHAAKPNVLLIVTDQQSYNTISALATPGNGTFCRTPNIDRLVKSGTAFTQTYCANPVSVASRFSLFTGLYGGEYRIRENQSATADEAVVRSALSAHGMGHVFKRAGYQTVYGGKVHLPFAAATGSSKFVAPVAYGFDTYLTKDEREGLATTAAAYIRNRKSTDGPLLLVTNFLNPHDICLEGSTNLSTTIAGNKEEKIETVRLLRQRAAAIDSVLFYRDYAPQLPVNFALTTDYPNTKCARTRFLDLPDWYWRKYRWTYAELVSLVDAHIGQVLDALDANPELKRNTIIVFTADHGEMQGAHHAMTKSLPYEECQRVPFLFAGPGIPAGKQITSTTVNNGVDLLPTLCELTGIEAPADADGVSLASAIRGTGKVSREGVIIESETFVSAVQGDYKYTLFDGDGRHEMLFDLRNDPGEKVNIIATHAAEAAPLRSLVAKHIEKVPVVTRKGKNARGSEKATLKAEKQQKKRKTNLEKRK